MNPDNMLSCILQGNNLDFILFRLAIDLAEKGSNVWFISQEPFTEVPKNITQPEKNILQKLTFIYLKDFNEVLKHLNSTHKWHKVPSIIIIKDFHLYCDLLKTEHDFFKTGLLTASLLDSAACCSKKLGTKSLVLISISEYLKSNHVSERLQVLYDMYFEKFFFKKLDSSKDEQILEDIKQCYFSSQIK